MLKPSHKPFVHTEGILSHRDTVRPCLQMELLRSRENEPRDLFGLDGRSSCASMRRYWQLTCLIVSDFEEPAFPRLAIPASLGEGPIIIHGGHLIMLLAHPVPLLLMYAFGIV